MSPERYVALAVAVVASLIIAFTIFKFAPKRLRRQYFANRWKRLQDRCSDESQWVLAIIEADNLLDEALKKKRFKGKSAGERLVKAQKTFTNNDAVWFGHKLRTKLDANPALKLTKNDVQKALIGLRQGLKDIGAL
ncbi:MAG: hypothetical protein ACR2FM_05280 [Candidatus Saccharimonadales bacterium]